MRFEALRSALERLESSSLGPLHLASILNDEASFKSTKVISGAALLLALGFMATFSVVGALLGAAGAIGLFGNTRSMRRQVLIELVEAEFTSKDLSEIGFSLRGYIGPNKVTPILEYIAKFDADQRAGWFSERELESA